MLGIAFGIVCLLSMLGGFAGGVWAARDDKKKPELKEPPLFDDNVQALLDTIAQHPDMWQTGTRPTKLGVGYAFAAPKLGAAVHAFEEPYWRTASIAENGVIVFSVNTNSTSDYNLDVQRWRAIHAVLAKHARRGFTDRVLKAVEGGAA